MVPLVIYIHYNMKERVVELDYLKCILILLMVLFHLAYFSEKYPLLKQFVYAFHMPVFLILSGYLTNINKGTKKKSGKFYGSSFHIH